MAVFVEITDRNGSRRMGNRNISRDWSETARPVAEPNRDERRGDAGSGNILIPVAVKIAHGHMISSIAHRARRHGRKSACAVAEENRYGVRIFIGDSSVLFSVPVEIAQGDRMRGWPDAEFGPRLEIDRVAGGGRRRHRQVEGLGRGNATAVKAPYRYDVNARRMRVRYSYDSRDRTSVQLPFEVRRSRNTEAHGVARCGVGRLRRVGA